MFSNKFTECHKKKTIFIDRFAPSNRKKLICKWKKYVDDIDNALLLCYSWCSPINHTNHWHVGEYQCHAIAACTKSIIDPVTRVEHAHGNIEIYLIHWLNGSFCTTLVSNKNPNLRDEQCYLDPSVCDNWIPADTEAFKAIGCFCIRSVCMMKWLQVIWCAFCATEVYDRLLWHSLFILDAWARPACAQGDV